MSELSQEQYAEIELFLVRHIKNGATIKPGKDNDLFVLSCDKVINCGLEITYPGSDLTPEPHE